MGLLYLYLYFGYVTDSAGGVRLQDGLQLTRMLYAGLRTQISLVYGCLSHVSVVCCQVEVFVTEPSTRPEEYYQLWCLCVGSKKLMGEA
jgi:hypothetical protein